MRTNAADRVFDGCGFGVSQCLFIHITTTRSSLLEEWAYAIGVVCRSLKVYKGKPGKVEKISAAQCTH